MKRESNPIKQELKSLNKLKDEIRKILIKNSDDVLGKIEVFHRESIRLNSSENIAEALYFLGYYFNSNGKVKKSLRYFNEAKLVSKDRELVHRINICLGVSYRQIGLFRQAIEAYGSALSTGIETHLDAIYNNLGVLFYHLKDLDRSVSYFEKVFELYQLKKDVINSLGILNNIGKALTNQCKYDEAKLILYKAKVLAAKNDLKIQIVIADLNLGNLYFKLCEFEKSYRYLREAYLLCELQNNTNMKFSTALLLGEVCQHTNRVEDAYYFFEVAFSLSEKIGLNNRLICLNKFHLFLEHQGDYKKSLFYLKLKQQTYRSLYNKQKKEKLFLSRVMFENMEQQLEFQKINRVNVIHSQLRKKAKQEQLNHVRLKKAVAELVEGQLLRTQMNPDFIYNSLNSISSLIKVRDNINANKYLLMFSKLMRDLFLFSTKDKITLKDELAIVLNYINMELLRFNNKFSYELKIDKQIDLKAVFLPPMIIQSLVENLIKYNTTIQNNKLECKISINICKEFHTKIQNVITKIEVRDRGLERNLNQNLVKKIKNQIILRTIRKRLMQFNELTNLNYSFVFSVSLAKGTVFLV